LCGTHVNIGNYITSAQRISICYTKELSNNESVEFDPEYMKNYPWNRIAIAISL